MPKVFIDCAVSIDGYWADADGTSVYPRDEVRKSALAQMIERTGAVIMSRRSFEMAKDPDWFAGNYELQVPLHIITDKPPTIPPREGGGVTFTFCRNFAEALTAARAAAETRDVAVIGERSAVEAALASGAVDEIYLRVVTAIAGGGERLIDQRALAGLIKVVDRTENAVHLHLARRDR